MKIEMKFQVSGTRDGIDWPAPGGTIDVPDAEGEQLVAQGVAGEVDAGKAAAGSSGKPATIKRVLAEVGDDPELAVAALELEQAQDEPRSSLIEKLEAIATAP